MDSWTKRGGGSKVFPALPESGVGTSKSVKALRRTKSAFGDVSVSSRYWCRDVLLFIFFFFFFVLMPIQSGCSVGSDSLLSWSLVSGYRGWRARAQQALTERGSVEAGHRAGHEEVGDLPEGQQSGRVVPFPLLLLDQTLQLLFEGLERERDMSRAKLVLPLICFTRRHVSQTGLTLLCFSQIWLQLQNFHTLFSSLQSLFSMGFWS